ncbi:gamma-glutamylcyclotransferase family protein [Roseovarius sp. M141]|uniref:gamma-glutamylcyclotransferase family protein n=1 Tax=Roseovarius sp. M141 TaxID=2583806 RepID=UPI0020CC7821|nr:gamma-glutamylcyclotransferase family protein [Roseovarius sp. M141]MCQ0092214.1 gamma-glutamylcyclotransferase [Roseovarius sp. M141]
MNAPAHAYFFGYGSLVNRDTHTFKEAHPARLNGWRRTWRPTNLREVAFLSVSRQTGGWIDGLIAPVPDADWHALDIREGAYDRVPAEHMVDHPLPHRPQIAVYSVPDDHHHAASDGHHLLLSYIDVVVQGYLREFGAGGAQHFFDTTDGWDAPVLDDRADPHYPRACRLSGEERDTVDAALTRLAVKMRRA